VCLGSSFGLGSLPDGGQLWLFGSKHGGSGMELLLGVGLDSKQ
jgi:hypothetical protein